MGFENWNFGNWDCQKIDDRIRLECQERPSVFRSLCTPPFDIRKGVSNAKAHKTRTKEKQGRSETVKEISGP